MPVATMPAQASLDMIQAWFSGWYVWETSGRWHARRRDEHFQQEARDDAPAYAVHADDPFILVVYLTVQSGCVLPDLEWYCELPRTEARWLASEHGPLGSRTDEGFIAWEGEGWVTMDDAALQALKHLGSLSHHADGRITYSREDSSQNVPCVTFGRDMYPVQWLDR